MNFAVYSPRFLALMLVLLMVSASSAIGQVAYPASPGATVRTVKGVLQGAEPAPGVRAYLGIPYAMPPVGPLRWQPPRPYASWPGVRTALKHGLACPQQKFGWNDRAAEHSSEDCLFLNVWAPGSGTRRSKLPVMVYIHGGSNVAGTASEELSNGLTLVPRGVVLVTLDYRLGILGFLRSPALDAESPHRASGNYGLLDQIAALQWVQRNIAAFGGDPGNVTVFGESAGAVDTGLLMSSPLARGLFAKAIEESGQVLGLMPTASQQESEQAWAPVVQELGTSVAAMRGAPLDAVLKADADAPKPPPPRFWGHRGASVDGWVLPADPSQTFAEGKEAPVPLLLGSNIQEIVPQGQTPEQTKHAMELLLPASDARRLAASYERPAADPQMGDMGARFATDKDFRCAVRQIAEWHASHGFPTFVYQFDRAAGGSGPAKHGSELVFVFHFLSGSKQDTLDDVISRTVEDYWTRFARTGVPEVPQAPAWPRFGAEEQYLEFPGDRAVPVVGHGFGGEACAVLQGDVLRSATR